MCFMVRYPINKSHETILETMTNIMKTMKTTKTLKNPENHEKLF